MMLRMTFLRRAGAIAALSIFAAVCASPAQAQSGPISGVNYTNFDYTPDDYTTMELGWDAATYSVTVKMVKNPNVFIGNYYLIEHYLIYGTNWLPFPLALDAPFYGHPLWILPEDVLGPLPGGESSIQVPQDANLVGMEILFQGIATFITTVSFPIEPEYVLTNGAVGAFY